MRVRRRKNMQNMGLRKIVRYRIILQLFLPPGRGCLSVHDVVDKVTWQAVDTKAHSLGHLCETFRLDLMLERERGEVGPFSVNMGLDKCKCSSLPERVNKAVRHLKANSNKTYHTVQRNLVQFAQVRRHVNHQVAVR